MSTHRFTNTPFFFKNSFYYKNNKAENRLIFKKVLRIIGDIFVKAKVKTEFMGKGSF